MRRPACMHGMLLACTSSCEICLLQVMKGLVGRLQDLEDEVRIAAIEGVTAAAKHSLALLEGTLAPLNEARKGRCMPCIRHACT
jgi:hypothetical protein